MTDAGSGIRVAILACKAALGGRSGELNVVPLAATWLMKATEWFDDSKPEEVELKRTTLSK